MNSLNQWPASRSHLVLSLLNDHGVGSSTAAEPREITAGETADPSVTVALDCTSTVDLVCASCRISLVLGSAESSTTTLSPITVHWQDAPAWHQESLNGAIERLLADHAGHFLQVLARRWHQYSRYFLDNPFIVVGDTSEPGYASYSDYIRGWRDPTEHPRDHGDPGQPRLRDPTRDRPTPVPGRRRWGRFLRGQSWTAAQVTRAGGDPHQSDHATAPSRSGEQRGLTPQLGSPLLDRHDPATADTLLLICVPCRLEVELGRATCHTTGVTGPIMFGGAPMSQDRAAVLAVWRLLTDHAGHDLITLPLTGTAYAWFRDPDNEPVVRIGTHHTGADADADLTHATYTDGWPGHPTHPPVQGATPVAQRAAAGSPDAATTGTTGDLARAAAERTTHTHVDSVQP